MNPPRIVLVRPSHPGNIGAAARAMKTMGLSELYLVSPKIFPDEKANMLATHAEDILNNATVVENIPEALKNITYVYAACANQRDINLPVFTPKTAAEKIVYESRHAIHSAAILFGPENHGLAAEDLSFVHGLMTIPASAEYHSLNLAAAVQIMAYEYHCALLEIDFFADMTDMRSFYEHLEQQLINLEFLDPQKPRQLMPKLRNLFNRTHLKQNEISILRGILKAIEVKTTLKKS